MVVVRDCRDYANQHPCSIDKIIYSIYGNILFVCNFTIFSIYRFATVSAELLFGLRYFERRTLSSRRVKSCTFSFSIRHRTLLIFWDRSITISNPTVSRGEYMADIWCKFLVILGLNHFGADYDRCLLSFIRLFGFRQLDSHLWASWCWFRLVILWNII